MSKKVSLTNEQLMMLLDGTSCRSSNNLNLTEEWSKIVDDNDDFAALTDQIHSWLDDEYAKKLSEMTQSYEERVKEQDKIIRSLRHKMESMEWQVHELKKSVKRNERVLKKDDERIREVLGMEDVIKESRKNYKRLEKQMHDISKFIKQLTFYMNLAVPGDSIKKSTKRLKNSNNYSYYEVNSRKKNRIIDVECKELQPCQK